MYRYRDSTYATSGFGRQVIEVLRRSASRSTAFKSGRKRIFLFDTDEGLRDFKNALDNVLRERRGRVSSPQADNLSWALGWTHSMLLIIHGDSLHIMGHEDSEHFEDVLCRRGGVRLVLKEFQGIHRPQTYGNLSLVPA